MEKYFRVFVCLIFSLFNFKVSFAYPLPFMADEAWRVDQTWGGTFSHSDELALDMNMGSEYDDEGLAVLTACSGTVVYADWTQSAYGRVVLVECGVGIYQRTAHLKQIFVQEGQTVREGQVVGTVGGSGWDSRNGYQEYKWLTHLHWNFMATNSPGTITSIEYTVEYQGGTGGALAEGYSYTSTNNGMFSEVEDEYGGYIGPATNAIHFYDSTTGYPRYNVNGAPDDVYAQDHDDSGTSPGTSAIIYDAFGGARKAYLVRSGFWGFYDECGGPNGDCSGVSDSGASCTANPNVHDCGAPINDEYEQDGGTAARQDFQSCYLYWDGDCVTTHTYPVVGPGWTSGGWNSTYSYAFAEAYERSGARNTMGEPSDVVDGAEVHHWNGDSDLPLLQDFEEGSWGWAVIMHSSLDNNAYVIRTGFWDKYQDLGAEDVGYPCEDEYPVTGGAQQEFQKLTMTWNGSTVSTTSKSEGTYGCGTRTIASDQPPPQKGDLYDVSGTVYWYDGRSLRGVVSADVFNACGFDWGEIQEGMAGDLDPLGWGEAVDDPVDCGMLQDGDLFTHDGTTTIYQYVSGLKRGITSGDVFTSCGFNSGNVQVFPASSVLSIPDGSVINSSSVCYLTPDLVWRQYSTGNLTAWFMDGTTVDSGSSISSSDMGWSVVGSGDFNRDGSVDLLWRHNSSPYEVSLWELSGTTVVNSILISSSSDPDWVIRGVSDFTSDGEPDVLWKDQYTGELSLWVVSQEEVVTSVEISATSDTSWDIRATGDLTGDGKADIVWRNPSSGALSLWQMDDTSYVSSIPLATSTLTTWDVEAIGDFTQDGLNDILWRNPTTGEMSVWEMDGTSYVSSISMTSSDTAWDLVTVGGMGE